jgi:hypothetical protein
LAQIKKQVKDKHARKQTHARKSKSSAMTEIRSESQRILRESVVGLPYFKPKQKSLDEFLNRKKGTPEVVQSIKIAQFRPQDDVLLQKRQKQLEEFYKKDIDDVDNVIEKEDVVDKSDEKEASEENGSQSHEKELFEQREIENENISQCIDQESMPKDSESIPKEDNTDTCTSLEQTVKCDNTGMSGIQPEDTNAVKDPEVAVNDDIDEDNGATESFNLFMEETPDLSAACISETTCLESSQTAPPIAECKQDSKIAALKCRLADPRLEQSLNITPRLGSGTVEGDDLFSPSGSSMSDGAKQLFERFVTHAQAKGPPVHLAAAVTKPVENLSIITKQVNSDGVEVLGRQTLTYNRGNDKRNKTMKYETLKEKLRQEMQEKRRAERKKREEILKLNNEEYGDELPDEEEVMEEFEANEETSDEESGETESEPEENDIVFKDKKSRKNLFVDDEAEESAEEEDEDVYDDDGDDDDDESLHLTQDDDNEDSDKENRKSAVKRLKGSYKKIRAADLLSEDSNTCSQHELPTARTPVAGDDAAPLADAAGGCASLQFSNLSSASSSMMNTEPRWTPFTERQDSAAAGTHVERGRTPSAEDGRSPGSPTSSQLARKRLGFEGTALMLLHYLHTSVADPDPGSGAFLPPGSGIRDGAMVGSGSGIRDK